MLAELEKILDLFNEEIKKVNEQAEIFNIKSRFLGKKGMIPDVLKGLRNADGDQKKIIGQKAQKVKDTIQGEITKKLTEIDRLAIEKKLKKQRIDFSLTDSVLEQGLNQGGYHPVRLIQREIEDIFLSMGFEILDGPHIEDEFHNFEALNIPKDHPARDMQDTFWFEGAQHLLRTHTSTIQVRGMEKHKPPFKFVGPGKVFRCERTDASHDSCFHQFEGMVVAENVSVANLIYFMKTLLGEIFKKEIDVRLRPGFFPFVEPGFELDISCLICKGSGCSVCKQTGWVELLPCGMVHPNVLKAGGIDPDKYNGFAFGMGLDRLVMMKYEIDDIRLIHSGDLRFNSQFKAY